MSAQAFVKAIYIVGSAHIITMLNEFSNNCDLLYTHVIWVYIYNDAMNEASLSEY